MRLFLKVFRDPDSGLLHRLPSPASESITWEQIPPGTTLYFSDLTFFFQVNSWLKDLPTAFDPVTAPENPETQKTAARGHGLHGHYFKDHRV